jgi:hypothetical protein
MGRMGIHFNMHAYMNYLVTPLSPVSLWGTGFVYPLAEFTFSRGKKSHYEGRMFYILGNHRCLTLRDPLLSVLQMLQPSCNEFSRWWWPILSPFCSGILR